MTNRDTPPMAPAGRDIRMAGRELALAVLCHLESYAPDEHDAAATLVLDHPPRGEGEGEDNVAALTADARVRSFAETLVGLYREHRDEIDALVDATSRTWKLARMDRVDRNIVRIAATELVARPHTPRVAIVSEAVRMAARYGSERSAAFVNGLVEALARRAREPDPDPDPRPNPNPNPSPNPGSGTGPGPGADPGADPGSGSGSESESESGSGSDPDPEAAAG